MSAEPFEVYKCNLVFRDCEDARWCVVIRSAAGGKIAVMPISSQWALFEEKDCFRIEGNRDEIEDTGLPRESYVWGPKIYEALAGNLKRRVGFFGGELRMRFGKWIDIS